MKKIKKFDFRKKFVAASFFISLFAFILLHYYLPENKGYAWAAFLLVPLAPVITGLKKITISYSLLVVIIYLVLGFTCGWWHPGWILFLTIPVFYIFFPRGVGNHIKISVDDDEDNDEEYDEL